MDRLSIAARALQRLKSGETRPRASQADRHSQRYRIADRFSSEDFAVIARRYESGEQSTDLAKEHNIAKRVGCSYDTARKFLLTVTD